MEKELINGYTFEEANSLSVACQKKYEDLETKIVMKALTGEVGTNAQMIEALKDLNYEYQREMGDYTPHAFPNDLNPQLIKNFEHAEEIGENVIFCAQRHLQLLGVLKDIKNQRVWKNEEGQVCDENGVLLTKDLEHRVFEVIPGGKQ